MTQRLTERHPLFHLYVDFHSDRLSKEERQRAKSLLHDIHYGAWDTREADLQVRAQATDPRHA